MSLMQIRCVFNFSVVTFFVLAAKNILGLPGALVFSSRLDLAEFCKVTLLFSFTIPFRLRAW